MNNKHEVSISIITKFTNTLNNKTHQFKKSLSGDYSVAKKYSQTLNNEKKIRTFNKQNNRRNIKRNSD